MQEIVQANKLSTNDYRDNLLSLANFYVDGYDIDWDRLHDGESKRKISLPTYPFGKKCYQVPEIETTETSELSSISSFYPTTEKHASNQNIIVKNIADVSYFEPVWKKTSISDYTHTQLDSPILVFDDHMEMAKILRKMFPTKLILCATTQKVDHEFDYFINRIDTEDYVKLFAILEKKHLLPKKIICKLNLSTPSEMSDKFIQEQLEKSYFFLIHLTQALFKSKLKHNIKILIINEMEDGKYSLFTEALPAFVKTLHSENVALSARVIHVQGQIFKIADKILAEFYQPEIEVYYDLEQERWTKHYIESKSHIATKPILLKKRGVYLITGGTGGIGLIFARYLAQTYQAKLILIGRSELNNNKKTLIAELENMGAEVIYITADVTKSRDVKRLLEKAKNKFGEINGIFHAAGIVYPGLISQNKISKVSRIIAPKIYGTVHLDLLTRKDPLDFFVLFSSISSVFGDEGLSDYAYGSNFMNIFAERRELLRSENKRQGKTISIIWPYWAEGGMQATQNTIERLEKALGILPLSTKDGIDGFIYALNSNASQLIMLKGYKNQIVQNVKQIGLEMFSLRPDSQDQQSTLNNSLLLERIRTHLVQIVSGMLKIDTHEIDTGANLNLYGMDSITLTILINQINETYNINITPAVVFTYGSIDSLSKYLQMKFQKEIIYTVHSDSTKFLEKSISNEDWLKRITHNNLNKKIIQNKITQRLFCFPYAGGSPWIFSEWSSLLPKHIEVYPIDFHLNNEITKDTLIERIPTISDLVDRLAKTLPLDLPFSFFGCCLGAIVAYELIKNLQLNKELVPQHLFVAACSAPHLYPIAIKDTIELTDTYRKELGLSKMGRNITPQEYIQFHNAESKVDREVAIKLLEKIGFKDLDKLRNNEDVFQAFFPRLIVDMSIAMSYSYDDDKISPLTVPITAISGENDKTIRPGFLNAWEIHTNNYELIKTSGDHYLIHEFQKLLINLIIKSMSNLIKLK